MGIVTTIIEIVKTIVDLVKNSKIVYILSKPLPNKVVVFICKSLTT